MTQISQAQPSHHDAVADLFREYLEWVCPALYREYQVPFDPAVFLEHDLANLAIFAPPEGRLLLAQADGVVAGCACVRTIGPRLAEIKRMYVRPAYRRQGLGRALVDACLDEMRAAGYTTMRLDSARFMTDAHALYHAVGFRDRGPYPESEIPPEFRAHWVFMERPL
jgi:GNAT superfamily N-acetyltransferase